MNHASLVDVLVKTLNTYLEGAVRAAPRIALAVVLILLTWLIVMLIRVAISKVGGRVRLRQNLIDVFKLMAGTTIWLVGILVALAVVFPSITPGKALTTLGLGSVAIGFAFKDTFENFLAGILILMREPFSIGDFIEVDGNEGQIEDITIRDSRVRMTDGQLIVMPNHTLFSNPVTVRTNRQLRRTTVICGVAYKEDVDKAREVIREAVKAVETVRDDVKDVQIFAQAFGASSIDFEVTWWTGSKPVDIRASRDQVVGAVKRALDDAGIEIPFPYRTMTFDEPLRIETVEAARDGDG